MPTLKFRAIFISDIHLGTRDAHCEQLLEFLRSTECDDLYLLGDVIDLWKARSGWRWDQLGQNVIHMFIDKARRGTRVTYVPGNHDEAMRDYAESVFEGVSIKMEAEHRTADGRLLLLIHGDEFDTAVKHSGLLYAVGSGAYDVLLLINRWQNRLRRRLGLRYWSLSGFVKERAGGALRYITRFEQAAAHEAARRGFDGVVCGHIHRAAHKDIGDIAYANTGDWVESCSAIAEDHAGRLHLIRWAVQREELLGTRAPVLEAEPEPQRAAA